MHLHLDPVGGIAGDMFIAALLDCFPEMIEGTSRLPQALGLFDQIRVACKPHNNGILTGRRFFVEEIPELSGHHHHTSFRKIRSDIHASALAIGVKDRAIAIFELLARAEAEVHGMPLEDVSFHEVGALDSIADIVTASSLIEDLGSTSWSIAPIPMGSGRVNTQHGLLPVPAPATLNLLSDFVVFEDGIQGERITPTGAAIVRHLNPSAGLGARGRTLRRSGTGFGSKEFAQIPNILRVMAFQDVAVPLIDRVTVFAFEIDDQTPEDLAVGLDRIRQIPGTLDVTVSPVTAKKGRQAQRIQILGSEGSERGILDGCFEQTTTIGVRYHTCLRESLPRSLHEANGIGVKVVERPSGRSAKAESDDLVALSSTAVGREEAAQRAVQQTLGEINET